MRRGRGRRGGPIGVVLVDKPAGPTSAEVVDWLRWSLRGTAVGHCGTLDPAATGLLVCCVGAATKLAAVLTDDNKRYQATIALGRSTTTADAQGDTLLEEEVTLEALQDAKGAMAGLVGRHQLRPPAFSAVKVDGKRAHERAREGEDVELERRAMRVFAVDDMGIDESAMTVSATLEVSKGTYIRSLAQEVGRQVGVPAHLAGLRRVGCGRLRVSDARVLSGFDVQPRPPTPEGKPRHRLRLQGAASEDRIGQGDAVRSGLIDPAEALTMPKLVLIDDERDRALLKKLSQGQAVAADLLGAQELPPGPAAVVCEHPAALILVELQTKSGAKPAPVPAVGDVTPQPAPTDDPVVLVQPQRIIVGPTSVPSTPA